MDYCFQLEIECGEFEGLQGTIQGTLSEEVSYPSQISDLESKMLAFAACYGIARSMIIPSRSRLVEFLEYWQEGKEAEADLAHELEGEHEHEVKTCEQTELF